MSFDPEAIREQFPILKRQVNGRPLVYLDNAASAQKPRAVIEAMTRLMETSYSNVHRGLHTLANETTEAYERARAAVARFINAPSPNQIVFTKGGTEAINLVASTFGRSRRKCQGTMLAWCSISESTISSPAPSERPNVDATRLIASVPPLVNTIWFGEGALMNRATAARARS